jgi:hypothetical protein
MRMGLTTMAAIFTLGLAGPALAQATISGSAAADHQPMHHRHNARQGAAAGDMASGQHMQAMHMAGAHSMTGTITSINHRTGLLGFKTPEGALRIHFPPHTIRHLRSGETITVYLGYEPGHGTHGRMAK